MQVESIHCGFKTKYCTSSSQDRKTKIKHTQNFHSDWQEQVGIFVTLDVILNEIPHIETVTIQTTSPKGKYNLTYDYTRIHT